MKASIFLIILALCVPPCLAQSQKIFGAYLHCEFVCTALKINSDFTFEHLLDGDLFDNKRTKGTWRFIGKNQIRVESQKPSESLQVKEQATNRSNFLIIVTDFTGAVIPTAEVSSVVNGQYFKCATNENGECEIPKSKTFELTFLKYRGIHKVSNSNANKFRVELSYEQMDTIIDDIWLIEGNRLYQKVNSTFNKDYFLEKVSQRRGRKLFPR